MLGAIGHDLKTPLAALRVRIESVEDDNARTKMAATIEDITRTLDEILSLARIGRSDATPEMTELGALAASVMEEFEDMGQPVTLSEGERVAAPVHLTWLKRGLRNLVTNALRYAGSAEVAVLREGENAVLRVDDDGPASLPPARSISRAKCASISISCCASISASSSASSSMSSICESWCRSDQHDTNT